MEYNILIIGSDINAYYMARCYHEEYHKKAYVLANTPLPYTKFSNILNIFYNTDIWSEEGFLKAIYKFKKDHQNKKTVLISSNESYAKFISQNKEKLIKDNFIFNYPSLEILESLIMKEKFYKMYKDFNISIPKTFFYDCSKDTEFLEKITYPVILKPSNVIMYNHISFTGKNKIYKIDNKNILDATIKLIKSNGYTDSLIIQDYIPGDDSYLFDAVAYVDTNHKVQFLSLAQIGLQEHSKNLVGNAAVLINGYNQFGKSNEIEKQMKNFLEKINYQGFCEFDLKYDYRDQTYKVLEINARQGRCSYYLTPLGFNLVKVLIDDLIYHKTMKYQFIKKTILLSFVPKKIAKKYIVNDKYKEEVLKLWNTHVNPVKYKKDRNFLRIIYYIKRDFRYYKEYHKSYWKNN